MTENDVLYYQDLILPKLQAIENYGDGATIHDAKTYIGKINLSRKLYYLTRNEICLKNWSDIIIEAEYWMVSVAGG